MTGERPKPLLFLGETPNLDPKKALKLMLEASKRADQEPQGVGTGPFKGPTSPLSEVDPMALDELLNRIDSGALALGQVPDPKDIAELVSYYWKQRSQFVIEQQLGLTVRPKRKPSQSIVTLTKSLAEVLAEEMQARQVKPEDELQTKDADNE
jgi:hypothetical protein